MKQQISTLSNGLRVITDYVPEIQSVALGIWCDVGARFESMNQNGIAHLVEHMLFKGTDNRSALDIVEQVEDVGGQMNAYTSRETTAYYIHLLKDDVALALDILSDMVQHPTFPEDEMETERGVIIQEIGMSRDTPDDHVFDLHQAKAYPDQPLGAPILGTANIIAAMTRKDLQDYVARFYTPAQMVISAAGSVDHDDFVRQVEAAFADMPATHTPVPAEAAHYAGGRSVTNKELEQIHLVMGYQGVSRNSDEYYAAGLLASVLGGGMSSRLFQEVREKRGLAYTVFSHHTPYRDDGHFEIYAGTGPESMGELLPVIEGEIARMAETPVYEAELNRAKAQLKAAILMGQESMLGRANRQAKYFLTFGELPDMNNTLARIDAVTPAHMRDIANQIFTSPQTYTTLGPTTA